jgi:hypothetical protein
MSDIRRIPGTDRTYGRDEFGEYGSIFMSDEEEQVEPFAEEDSRLAERLKESEERIAAEGQDPASGD